MAILIFFYFPRAPRTAAHILCPPDCHTSCPALHPYIRFIISSHLFYSPFRISFCLPLAAALKGHGLKNSYRLRHRRFSLMSWPILILQWTWLFFYHHNCVLLCEILATDFPTVITTNLCFEKSFIDASFSPYMHILHTMDHPHPVYIIFAGSHECTLEPLHSILCLKSFISPF